MTARRYGQYCGVTRALELVGERWALLIVRDLLVGPRRYGELKVGLPKIPTNILAKRLTELQDAGVVRRLPLRRGLLYSLTPYGRALEPIVLALGAWGFEAMREPGAEDIVTVDSMTIALRTAFQPDWAAKQPPTVYDLHCGDVALRVRVARDLQIAEIQAPEKRRTLEATRAAATAALLETTPDLTLRVNAGVRHMIKGTVSPDEAVERGYVRIVEGDAGLLERFGGTFHIPSDPAHGLTDPVLPASSPVAAEV